MQPVAVSCLLLSQLVFLLVHTGSVRSTLLPTISQSLSPSRNTVHWMIVSTCVLYSSDRSLVLITPHSSPQPQVVLLHLVLVPLLAQAAITPLPPLVPTMVAVKPLTLAETPPLATPLPLLSTVVLVVPLTLAPTPALATPLTSVETPTMVLIMRAMARVDKEGSGTFFVGDLMPPLYSRAHILPFSLFVLTLIYFDLLSIFVLRDNHGPHSFPFHCIIWPGASK